MDDDILVRRGSLTARNGFVLERAAAAKFTNWRNDSLAASWVERFGYDLDEVVNVVGNAPRGHEKADVCVCISMRTRSADEFVSVKRVSNETGFNQIDKRWVRDYADMWNMPADVVASLKKFTGETRPGTTNCRDRQRRRLFLDELPAAETNRIVEFFAENMEMIVGDLLRGTGPRAPNWILVWIEPRDEWTLMPMENAIEHYSAGEVCLSPRGSLNIGKITMQRKGGDGGRPTANMLQFKMDPSEIVGI